jgi:glucose-1-phosphate thymidylyltransferase
MRLAGIEKAYIVLRKGKWDIPAYFGDGSLLDMRLAYLALEASPGVPFTLDHAYPFVRDAMVAFGFPDILFDPDDAFKRLLVRHSETQADVVLGLCPTTHPSKYDAVKFDKDGAIQDLIPGPTDKQYSYGWAIALWTPAFTEFLHDYVRRNTTAAPGALELTAGHAIKAALKTGLGGNAVVIGEEPYLDIGTPNDLARAIHYGIDGFPKRVV